MHLQILAFAHAHDQLGFRERLVEYAPTETPRQLLARLAPATACGTMRVALDREYADWDTPIGQARELAILPPVSGG